MEPQARQERSSESAESILLEDKIAHKLQGQGF